MRGIRELIAEYELLNRSFVSNPTSRVSSYLVELQMHRNALKRQTHENHSPDAAVQVKTAFRYCHFYAAEQAPTNSTVHKERDLKRKCS